jgi:hypothetical protein
MNSTFGKWITGSDKTFNKKLRANGFSPVGAKLSKSGYYNFWKGDYRFG